MIVLIIQEFIHSVVVEFFSFANPNEAVKYTYEKLGGRTFQLI